MPRFIKSFLLSIAAILFAVSSFAQIEPDAAHWKYEVKKTGENKYDLIFHMSLDKGYHIWSLKPGGDGLQMPPEFNFDKTASVKFIGGIVEKGKKITGNMDGVDGIVSYFENKVDYIQSVEVTGNGKVTGKQKYQVCDEQHCQSPQKVKFSFEITDAKETAAATPVDTTATAAVMPATDAAASDTNKELTDAKVNAATPEAQKKNLSWVNLFVSGLGNGLLSVITPCVFAMLPMTVSFFLKRSKDRKTGIKISLQYSLSIVLIFTVIGGVISAFLGPDALHSFSTNWIVNVVFFIIFMIFGISFLGAFEISLPSSWATKLDSKANTQSFLGIFFMALTLVIVSFSCTVPFIGNMVVMIQEGGKFGPLLGFFGFGLGLALPFTLFALFPSLLQELGKSGGWLNAVKVTFGFIEIALAMKFLSNADLQMQWRLLDREIFLAIWIGLSFTLGLYLLGFIRFSHDSELPKNDWGLTYLKVPRLFFALTSIIFAFYLIPGMWGAPLNGMGAFLPPVGTQDFVLTGGGEVSVASSTEGGIKPAKYVEKMKLYEPPTVAKFHLNTFFDYEEALAASKQLHKPVMIDFTGVNCANCRKFEADVWSNPEVIKRMKEDFVVVSLFVDVQSVDIPKELKHYSDAVRRDIESLGDLNVEHQVTKFGSNTQPYYFFVDENGVKLADKGISYPYAASDFVVHLDKVKAKYKELHP